MTKTLIVLFGDIRFDGRARRILESAEEIGETRVLNVTFDEKIEQDSVRHRVKTLDLSKERRKVFRHLRFWWFVFQEIRQLKPDVVFAENFFCIFPVMVSNCFFSTFVVYDAYELMIPSGDRATLHKWFWYQVEKACLPYVDLIITANPERSELMREHYGLEDTPVYVRNIPQQFTTPKHCSFADDVPSVFQRKSDHDVIILYQGDMSIERGLIRFIDALKHLPANYRFIFIGGGKDYQKILEYVRSSGLEQRFAAIGRVPHEMLAMLTRMGDLGIVTYPYIGMNNILCSPNKIFEYVQADLPIISTDQKTIRSLLHGYRIGLLVSENSTSKDIADMMVDIVTNKKSFVEDHSAFLSRYNYSSERERLLKVVKW